MAYKILDVSEWQPSIDYAKVAKNVDGVILRCGVTLWGKQNTAKDNCFEKHYTGFKAAGVPVGAYYYSAADSVTVAKREAEFCLSLLKGKQFELPIYYDVECEDRMGKVSRETLTEICIAFCEALENAGYFVGVYANTNYFRNKLNYSELVKRYTLWLADYRGEKADKTMKRDIWQYTSTGKVDGISGNVDLNECYRDFAKEIKAAGLNGYTKAQTAPEKTVAELAQEVLAGVWGNGADREKRLSAAGHDYDKVQAKVNEILNAQKKKPIEKGSRVRVKQGAKSYEGATVHSFVYNNVYIVDELKGKRAVLDLKGICTAFKVDDLIRV